MEQNSKRFTTFSVAVFLIAFHVVLIVPLIYRNSNFAFLKLLAAQTVTCNNNGFRFQNTTISDEGRCNCTISEVLQGKTQNGIAKANNNVIASQEGSKDDSSPRADVKEKLLLHGLLASGFDESSCISRVQSHLFRKASPHKPSPCLISKLRNYEELHRKCGPNSSAYNISMKNIERSKNNNAGTMCKYVVWIPFNGLGNQILSIAATFLYALLTDRVLLVKFTKDIENLYCEPFLNSTWVLPKNTPIVNERVIDTYRYQLDREKGNISMDGSPSVQFLINLSHKPSDHQKFFHCDDSQDHLSKVPLLIFFSDQYFLPSLFMIPLFNEELDKMFPDKDRIFHHLGRYLFHPSNEAWEIITNFYETNLAKADERIGIQIRVYNPTRTPQEAVMNLVLNCTKDRKILPELADVQNYSTTEQQQQKQSTKAVLVASLYAKYAEDLKAIYENKTTVTGEMIQVYQASHEEKQKIRDNGHNMKAWTDIYLLSLSDVLVTTSMSTFGYVAQGLGNLKPWHLYRILKNENHFPACERDYLSVEPCYHVPPKIYCDGKPIPNFDSTNFTHIRECRDYFPGAKVVNA